MGERELYDYAVVSEDWNEAPKTLAEAADGESILRRERLYRATDDGFGHDDDQIGVLFLEERRSLEPAEIVCRAVFRFSDEDSLTASGTLAEKSTDGGASVDNGRLGVVGGSGRFARARGQVHVQVENPKRWFAEDPFG
jgi:hypothetical protein